MSIIDINSYKLSMRTCFILLYIVRDVDMYFIQDNSYVIEFLQTYIRYTKKNLKIPKGQSESVYRRRTDNTMTKRKSTKGQTKHTDKAKDRVIRNPLKTAMNSGAPEG